MKFDALEAIGSDLSAASREKRRHFLPAVAGAMALVLGLLAMAGIRDDFAQLPLWRQISLGGSWIVGGLLFPAVGVGLWFPGRATRSLLAVLGIALPLAAVVGWPPGSDPPHSAVPCGVALAVLGGALLGVGTLSGAFAQRRSASATAWVAAGLTVAAMATTSWICPVDAVPHLAWGHLGPALALSLLALSLGRWLHGRQRLSPRAARTDAADARDDG